MESDNFEQKVKGWLSKGAKASKKAIETVGDKVQDFTDKSVVKMEKRQLETKLEVKYTELGRYISEIMKTTDCDNTDVLNLGSEENLEKIKHLQGEILSLITQISEKEKEIG